YTITVTNTGNVTLSNVNVTDPLTGFNQTIASLGPDGVATFTTTYTVAQADLDNGSVLNVATATGEDPDGDPVGPEDPTDGEVTTPGTQVPAFTLVKALTGINGDAATTSYSAVGDELEYTITVTNTGNVTLSDIEVEDALTGLSETIASLVPGAMETFITIYTITPADLENGSFVNTATAAGEGPNGDTVEPDDPATVTVMADPPVIEANDDDFGPVNGYDGGTTPSVLDNDTLNGDPVDPDDVTLAEVNPDPDSPLTLNPDGTVTVAPGTPVGDYTLEYTICEILNPDNCSTATVTITVTPAPIAANDDGFGPVNGTDGGTTPSVLDNDTLNGDPVDPDDITLNVGGDEVTAPVPFIDEEGTPVPGVVLNPNGTVTVSRGTPAGEYTLDYTICEELNPDNCSDPATVTVVVEAAPIEANDDDLGPVNGADGGTTPSVLDNDTLNGDPVDPDDITLTPGTPTDSDGNPTDNLTMNPDGTITVSPETPAGTYEFPYTICELVNPDNCSTATVTITVVDPPTVEDAERVTTPETPVTIPITDIVTPGTDGNPSITFPDTPEHFTATVDGDGNIIVTPGPDAPVGVPVEIPFEVEDEYGNKIAGVIVITVEAGMEANDDVAQVQSGGNTTIPVLSNDVAGTSLIDPATLRIVSPPANGTVTVNPDGTITYNSHTGFTGEDTFTYEVADENGNLSTATVTVTVTPRPLKIPNVFTPNGDGRNDVFEIVGIEGFDRIELTIVNRWGNEVYRNTNYQNNWNGQGLNEGTYYYMITTHVGAVRESHKGWVLIKRL
ncbi:DUF7507 domain-containing protein, partial [Parapedobacter pyrenivorans]